MVSMLLETRSVLLNNIDDRIPDADNQSDFHLYQFCLQRLPLLLNVIKFILLSTI